jgi:hypothetical protein
MKFFVLFFALFTFSVSAQTHMVQTATNLSGLLSISDDGPGKATYFSSQYIALNYAYTIAPRFQIGGEGYFSHSEYSGRFGSTSESWSALVGGYYNFSDDLNEAFYASLFGGYSWNWSHTNGSGSGRGEAKVGRLGIGKRFPLTFINIANVSYSPEITYTRSDYTNFESYTNNYTFRFIQFSVLF